MQAKVTCDVIRDLMILCEDDVCSEDSMLLIKEHISSCEECRGIYEQMKVPVPEIKLDEAKMKKNVDEKAEKAFRKMKKKMTLESMIIVMITVLLIVIISCVWRDYIEKRINVISPSEIEVTELYQLDNGDIYATLECDGKFSWDKNDTIYLPEGGNRFTSEEYRYELNFQSSFFWEWNRNFYQNSISILFPKETNPFGDSYGIKECVEIQYVGGNGKEVLTIWKEGQHIEEAPEAIEQKVEENYQSYKYGYEWGAPVEVSE